MTWRASLLATPARKVRPSGYCCRRQVITITTPTDDETTDTQPWQVNRPQRPPAFHDVPASWWRTTNLACLKPWLTCYGAVVLRCQKPTVAGRPVNSFTGKPLTW